MFTIVLGTHNRKKGIELAEFLAPFDITIKTLRDFDKTLEVAEDGATFLDNARKKAREQAQFLGHWTIGEDSGLSVDALDGAPGVFSARFSSTTASQSLANVQNNASDEDNNRFLLEKLKDVPLERRTAYYSCCAVLADPEGDVYGEVQGICRGHIRFDAAGGGGFGYDPLFEITEYHKTFGELSPAMKRAISHRARAMRQLLPIILEQKNR